MAESKNNTIKTTWVAIDVAKYKNHVLIEYPNGSQKSLVIAQTRDDFAKLACQLKQVNAQVEVALEPTGYYHRSLAYYLLNQGFTVRLISSIATARTRESQYNSLDKNDKKDTLVIMHLLQSGITQTYYEPLLYDMVDIQELANTYNVICSRKTKVYHSIVNHYLSLYFPEVEKYIWSTRAKGFAEFLYEFTCPLAITQFTLEQFIRKASPLAPRRINKRDWLKNIYQTAENSIGLPIKPESTAIDMFRTTLKDFIHLCTMRDSIEEQAKKELSGNDDYNRLQTVPGIGPIIALNILAQAGDISRFSHVRQFLKFCGFDLSTKQSGTYRGKSSLSKRGNASLRNVFWMASNVAIRMKDNSFRTKYENYMKGFPNNADVKRKAYVATAVKMARVVYSMITHHTDYCCTYEGQV